MPRFLQVILILLSLIPLGSQARAETIFLRAAQASERSGPGGEEYIDVDISNTSSDLLKVYFEQRVGKVIKLGVEGFPLKESRLMNATSGKQLQLGSLQQGEGRQLIEAIRSGARIIVSDD